ncbi:MAG: hypothetical protein V4736_16270 [Bdellovibrionota bacterium]
MKAIISILALNFFASHAYAVIDLTKPAFEQQQLVELIDSNRVTTLDEVPRILPADFKINFVLKHGIKRVGERGHLNETKVSQSADPLLPRAIIWDERSGFSISYNGGGEGQLAPHRLDLFSFNPVAKTFHLEQIDFPIQGKVQVTTTDCASCHGPRHRPIFGMYPDWPAFYGSDNDELTGDKEVQKLELADYEAFRKQSGHHPRYEPLFDSNSVQKYLGRPDYLSFPYRPDVSEEARNVSRSFSFRPALRMGILYNRMTAQSVLAVLKQNPEYLKWAPYFVFNLLGCDWRTELQVSRNIWNQRAQKKLGMKANLLATGILEYRQNLALMGLRINDIDIRYSYNHAGYANNDATEKVMEVGYVREPGKPVKYFNSYFDGSATIDELLAARILEDLGKKYPQIMSGLKFHGLTDKYQKFTDRFKLDKEFFAEMDKWGTWIPLYYPQSLSALHHRETYKEEFRVQQQNACRNLQDVFLK